MGIMMHGTLQKYIYLNLNACIFIYTKVSRIKHNTNICFQSTALIHRGRK